MLVLLHLRGKELFPVIASISLGFFSSSLQILKAQLFSF